MYTLWMALVLAFVPRGDPHRIGNGTWSVGIGDAGVLVAAPETGLRTVDGPSVRLDSAPVEWFGLDFHFGVAKLSAVGRGNASDWAGRSEVTAVPVDGTAREALCVARAGPLEVETRWYFESDGPCLIAAVSIVNRGDALVEDLLYTREWRDPRDAGWTFPPEHDDLPPAPRGICRRVWQLDPLPPGGKTALAFSYRLDVESAAGAAEVPLTPWTSASFPDGMSFGATNGISWGDFDRDGFIDVFACQSANLWRNLGGRDWQLAANLIASGNLVPTSHRYGSSFGDFDHDGLPDLGIEPRQMQADPCLHVLRNAGNGEFHGVTADAMVVSEEWCGDSETWCWADVDGDSNLDAFVPFYPPTVSASRGNVFYHNRPLPGPRGGHVLMEATLAAGLVNPPKSARPEGAFFADTDGDGDLDLFSNGTLYTNRSAPGTPSFQALRPSHSGIRLSGHQDEGAAFADYDMDGDQDLLIAYTGEPGATIWESRGDGTFFRVEDGVVRSPMIGLHLGLSTEDWDNDGDIDFTTRQVFRRNQIVETGLRGFSVATHRIPHEHIFSATPAWADWDKDGDLDCALGNWFSDGHFYESTLYGPTTAPGARRSVRVRPLRHSASVPDGLETEFGAAVEVRIAGESVRRRKLVSSAGGYLNQNEYALTMALPAAGADVEFDLLVDFPTPEGQPAWRLDASVNAALGAIRHSSLVAREIDVFRDGTVRIDGVTHAPLPGADARLAVTAGGLSVPDGVLPLAELEPAPFPDTFVGLALSTRGASAPVIVKELIVDGRPSTPIDCGGHGYLISVWDVTDPAQPFLAETLITIPSSRNRRHAVPCRISLNPGCEFRIVLPLSQLRTTPVTAPVQQGDLLVRGGLLFSDPTPCDAAEVLAATIDPTKIWFAARFTP
jgi:hypothetical protein